jgi:hypothetical protein
MTDRPTIAFLVPTISAREHLFRRLLGVLLPQLDEFAGAARVIAWRNDGAPRLAEIRDRMVWTAGTDYVAFIDDDDLVPTYYVAEIMRALSERPDHVGFQVDYSIDGTTQEIVDHSLKWERWHRTSDTPGRLVRDFTHIDPIRRELAATGRFAAARPGRAEDRVWVKQVRKWLAGASEVYIDKIMYHYLFSESISVSNYPERIVPAGAGRPEIDSAHFEWHADSDA